MAGKNGKNSGFDADSEELWKKVTQSIRPYKKNKTTGIEKPGTPKPPVKPKVVLKTLPYTPIIKPALEKPAALPKGFDRATETKLKKGKLDIEGRIDLHGMTQEEAHRKLKRFVLSAVAAEKRTLLVITGKGKVLEGGVLRRMLPLWCETGDLAPHVLALSPAQPKDGGSGAFYLRLRKIRK